MGDNSAIEWTDATWNPVRGCALVSKGCTNCYAMRQAYRSHGPGGAYEGLTKMTIHGPTWTGEVRTVPELLDQPLRWRRPRRIFVNSMSDLFHEDVPEQFITDVFGVMALAHWHTFQVLTKRPQRMFEYLSAGDHGITSQFSTLQRCGGISTREVFRALDLRRRAGIYWKWPFPNVWLGISAEDQQSFDQRWPYFSDEKFAGWPLFLSAEPLLGPLDIRSALPNKLWNNLTSWRGGELRWVIAGGESGPKARATNPEWIRLLQDDCKTAEVPFFFKQWGNWLPAGQDGDPDHEPHILNCTDRPLLTTKRAAGNMLDGRKWEEYPR